MCTVWKRCCVLQLCSKPRARYFAPWYYFRDEIFRVYDMPRTNIPRCNVACVTPFTKNSATIVCTYMKYFSIQYVIMPRNILRYCFYILRYNIPSNVTKYSAWYCLCIVTIRNISYMMNEIFCDTILSSNVTKYSVTLFVYYHERNTSRYDIASNTTDEIFHIYDVTNISRYNIASNDTKCSTVQYCLYITTGEIFHVQRHERNISRCDIASNGWDIPPYNATKYSAYCLYITTHEIFRGIKYCLYITTDEIFRTRRYGRNIPR